MIGKLTKLPKGCTLYDMQTKGIVKVKSVDALLQLNLVSLKKKKNFIHYSNFFFQPLSNRGGES